MAVLPAPAGLLGVFHLAVCRAGERFLVGHLRFADTGLDVELAAQPVDDDVQMQLAHTGDDDLSRLLVGLHAERRIFGHQLLQPVTEFFLVCLRLRLDRQRDHRLREIHRLENDRLFLVADRVAGRDAPQTHCGGDVAGVDLFDVLTLVRVHLQQTTDALAALFGRVIDARTRCQNTGINADEGKLADKRVGHDLERQR